MDEKQQLLCVRITPEQKNKLSILRTSGVCVSTKVRNYIDSLYETEIKNK